MEQSVSQAKRPLRKSRKVLFDIEPLGILDSTVDSRNFFPFSDQFRVSVAGSLFNSEKSEFAVFKPAAPVENAVFQIKHTRENQNKGNIDNDIPIIRFPFRFYFFRHNAIIQNVREN